METNQRGFGILPVIVVVLVIGVVGFAGWSVWIKGRKTTDSQSSATTTVEGRASDDMKSADGGNAKPVEFKTVTLNGYVISYPLNDNNKKVIVEHVDGFTDVSYKPVRDYFAAQLNARDVCKGWKAGRLWVDKMANSFGPGNAYGYQETLAAKQKKMTELIEKGKAAKVDDDVYVMAPAKQNEGCTETYESNDTALKTVLAEADKVETAWLKSIVSLK